MSLASPAEWSVQVPPRQVRQALVFLVDDDPIVTDSLQTLLTLETDHTIHTFNHPAAALHALNQYQPDLVISDFLMPDLNGIEFLQQVKSRLPETTCILLTGYADKENAIAAINQVGIYRYIEKPWDNKDLLLTLQNGLERAWLVQNLNHTIDQLRLAHGQLKRYNHELEQLIEERTLTLRQTYNQLQAVIHHSADGIILLSASLTLESINPIALEWLTEAYPAVSASDWRGQPLSGWMNDDRSRWLTQQLLSLPTLPGYTVRLDLVLGRRMVEAHAAWLSEGAEGGYVLTLRDMTQYRETERLREDFVSTLTHDMRTPLLAAIQTFDLFLDGTVGALTPQQTQLMQTLGQSHRDLLGLVNTLLEVYKYEAGQQTLIWDKVDMASLVDQVVQQLMPLAQAKDQALAAVVSPEIPPVPGDRQELRRVVVNLVGNAIHHTPRGGAIQIAAHRVPGGGEVHVTVADNGQGIAEEDCASLFQRFSQGTSRKRNSGTGLGLYLSRQIVEAHKGRIWVDSQEGVGSRFAFSLPVDPPAIVI